MSNPVALDLRVEKLTLRSPFRISGYVFEDVPALVCTLRKGGAEGRGEAAGVYYLDDLPDRMAAQVEAIRGEVEAGCDRAHLQSLLPAGGARNAVDCALWELEARLAGAPVWRLAGLDGVKPLVTTFTIGADDPGVMAKAAQDLAEARAIKLKLTGEADLDAERVRAVRAARPEVWLAVDGNQGFDPDGLDRTLPALLDAGVALLEQPFPRGREADLDGMARPIPVAADESVQGLDEVEALRGRFDVVNIKLDKCGGLTEALDIERLARRLGLQVMVGNMVGTTWAMGPAFVVGQRCDVVDLDGPVFLKSDRSPALTYQDGKVFVPDDAWGATAR